MSERIHELKCWPEPFDAIRDGRKRFEYRRDDRGFSVGDILRLRKWDPSRRYYFASDDEKYPSLDVRVTYILVGRHGVPDDFVVMSIEPACGRTGGTENE